MTNKSTGFAVKIVSLLISAVMLFECTAPAYAQAKKRGGGARISNDRLVINFGDGWRKLDDKLNRNVAPADNTRVVRPDPALMRPPYFDNPDWQEAKKISNELLFGSQLSAGKNEDREGAPEAVPSDYEQFLSQYTEAVNSQAASIKKENETFKRQTLLKINMEAEKYALSGEYPQEDISAWKDSETANLNSWFENAQSEAERLRKAELAKAKTAFAQYQAEAAAAIDAEDREIFKNVQSKVRALFSIYKKSPRPEIGYILLDTVPLFIPMNYNGEDLLNEEEKSVIFSLALNQLKKPVSLETQNINAYISAMTVIANISTPGDGGGAAVKEAVYSSEENPLFFSHILITAVSALLASKDYISIGDILRYFTNKEKVMETPDLLSIAAWVENIQMMNGKYLNGASSIAQYELEDGTVSNAFTDIALMLAEEGSRESLDLLKTYGVDQCAMTLDFNFKDTFSPRCGGIKPFVAGALISGKAGAENYRGPLREIRAGEQQFTSSGSVITVSADQAARNSAAISSNIKRFKDNAAASGLSANAYIAVNLINEGLGDITVKQEAFIDSALLKRYRNEIKNNMLGKYAVVDDARRASKESSLNFYKYAKIGGNVLDIGILVWCAWDLAKLGKGAYSLGRGAYSAFKLSRIGAPAQRMAYITRHLPHLKKYASAGSSMTKFMTRVKNGMEPIVLSQRALYTSAPLPKIAGAGLESTTVAKTLAAATFDAAKGGYAINAAEAYRASAGNPGRVTDILNTRKALDAAAASAQERYAARGFLDKYRSYRGYLSSSTKEAFTAAGLDSYSLGAGIDFANTMNFSRWFKPASLQGGATGGVEYLARPLGTSASPGYLELYHRSSVGAPAEPLPVNITIESKIPTIQSNKVTNVLLTGQDEIRLSMASERKLIDPSYFKIGIDDASFMDLARMSREGSTPLNIKFMGEPSGLWGRTSNWFSNAFLGKKGLFPGTGSVLVEEGGFLRPTSIKLSTPKRFDGMQMVVRENNTLSLLGRNSAGVMTDLSVPYTLALPKGQLNNFVKYASQGSFNNPFNLSLTGAKNKLNTLFAVQFLSLSAASTSLVGPLRQNYPDISNTDVALISIVLPYASSFLSPFWAPFVKRYGSANMVKASLGLAGASLTIPMLSGFNGFGDVNAMNPNKPSITPLLISGTLIGLSSSITRASFNPLMDKMGGGVGLLKGMAFKNLSSFAMLAPTLGASLWDMASPRYYTDADGNYLLNDKGDKILHSHTDFSLYNPFLLAITAGVFYKFQTARMPTHIGKVEGYTMSSFAKGLGGRGAFASGFNSIYRPVAGTLAETWNATKVLGHKAVWPVALASTAALGVESSLLYNYSQAESNKYTGHYIENAAVKPVVATLALTIPPFLTRLKSKPILKLFGGDGNPETYKRLIGASLISAGAGTALLATEDNMTTFIPGMALVGIGFSNTTNGLLKIGEYNLKAAKATQSMITGYKVAYPGVHIGMAIFPKLYSGAADAELQSDPSLSKNEALQNNIWIPALTLGGSALFYAKGANLLNFNRSFRIPTGLAGITRFTLGTPSAMFDDWRSNGLFSSAYGGAPGLTPSASLMETQDWDNILKEDPAPSASEEE